MILVSLGKTKEQYRTIEDQLKEFRTSPLGKWFLMNLEVWKQKVSQSREISGDEYRGTMSTLMDIQLMFAQNGKIESYIRRKEQMEESRPLVSTDERKTKVLKS